MRLLTLMLLLAGTICQAQKADRADERTNASLNGRFWNNMPNETAKLYFTLGYCEAAVGELACSTKAHYGEIVKGIDGFYQEPENLRLPLIAAMQIFALKVAGAKATEIEAVMNTAREYADKPMPETAPSPPPPK